MPFGRGSVVLVPFAAGAGELRGDVAAIRARPPDVAPSSLPGFMIPAGSQRSLTARRASRPTPTSASIQGAWSRPTAWWWVSVPPAASRASVAAAFAARH